MPAKTSSPPVAVFQLKITLRGSKPPIWRRIQVKCDITLRRLHEVIQEAMGWRDYHLHEFEIDGLTYGQPDDDFGYEQPLSERIRLSRPGLRQKQRFSYLYDFGDGWDHLIEREAVLPVERGVRLPRCTAGRRAGPPEDCGGIWGYQELIEIMADPNHPEYEDRREWLGRPFDPAAFSVDEVNQRFATMDERRRAAREASARDPLWGGAIAVAQDH